MDENNDYNDKRKMIKDKILNMINDDNNDLIKRVEIEEKRQEPALIDEVTKKWNLNEKILELFQSKLNMEIVLKKKYAVILIAVLIIQLCVLNISFILHGIELITISDVVFNIFVSGGLIEIYVLIKVIVNYIFKDDLSELLKVILNNENT